MEHVELHLVDVGFCIVYVLRSLYIWTFQAHLYTPRSCTQKDNWNEFVVRFKL